MKGSSYIYTCFCGKQMPTKTEVRDHFFDQHIEVEDAIKHGTESGYQRHVKGFAGWSAEPCDSCRLEHNKAVREWNWKHARGTGMGMMPGEGY